MTELDPAPTYVEGPTWRKTTDGKWWLPDQTLGWGVINWLAKYVRSPDGERCFLPTLEQARFILWWYAVNPDGRFKFRTGTYRRMKGAGKNPLAAALTLAELCGPVVFDRFVNGEPIGKRHPAAWVQVVAVSMEQTKNSFSLYPLLVTPAMKKDYGVEVNKTILYTKAGGRLEAVTSSPHSMEGNRPSFVVLDETQWWNATNGGHDLVGVVDGNVTKVRGARKLALCNAHVPGEDSVAEKDFDAWQMIKAGHAVDTGVLYDSIEAPPDTPVSEIPSQAVDPEGYELGLARLREGLEIARGDATWLDLDEVIQAILDVRNPISESKRKYLNTVNASEDSLVAPAEWDACAVPGESLNLGDRIVLGFDGSLNNDWTALVACRIEDGFIAPIKVWNPADSPTGEINRLAVDATVRSTFDAYNVVGMRADIFGFESYVDMWSRDFKRQLKINARPGHLIDFDMRGNAKQFALDCEKFLDSIISRELKHNGDPILRQHVLNAKRFPQTWGGTSIRKASKDSSRKIDAAVCAIMAYGLRQEFLMSKRGNRTGRAMVIK